MALDRSDIELLKGAKEKGLSIDEMIASAEQLLALNELKARLNEIGNQLSYKFSEIVENNIEEISKIDSNEGKINFIVKGAYARYIEEVEFAEKERIEREDAQRKRQEEQEKRDAETEESEEK